MQIADVRIDGDHRWTHDGGYLLFFVDISRDVQAGAPVTVLLRLGNRDNTDVSPGRYWRAWTFVIGRGCLAIFGW